MAIFFILSRQLYAEKVNIFACEPEWQALAIHLGKDKVAAFSATTAFQDAHYIRAKPSLIAKIKNSDLLICSGADLEAGWLPILLQKANYKLQPGQVGYLIAADFVPLLDKLAESDHIDRSMGDIHPEGNPHTHLNPYNILLIAKELNKRLKIIDSENAYFYQKNYDNFIKKWQKSIKAWELQARKLKKLAVIPYHKSFDYLLNWLQINEIATVENKPGLPPATKHLKNLLKIIERSPQAIIIRSAYDNNKATKWLNKKTNITVLTLPYTVGSTEKVTDLFSLFEQIIISLNQYVK